jgi:predicted transcriptional regulator
MNVTLSIEDELVKKARKIAVERDTTLSAMIREYLEQIASEDAAFGRQRRERDALEQTFRDLEFRVGKRTWKREDLYERS